MKKFPLLGLIILIITLIGLSVALGLSTISNNRMTNLNNNCIISEGDTVNVYYEYRILDGDTILIDVCTKVYVQNAPYYDDITWEEIPTTIYQVDGIYYNPITIKY